jgi:hypothetical protein
MILIPVFFQVPKVKRQHSAYQLAKCECELVVHLVSDCGVWLEF